jgi:hypothetical protein
MYPGGAGGPHGDETAQSSHRPDPEKDHRREAEA